MEVGHRGAVFIQNHILARSSLTLIGLASDFNVI